MTKIIFQYGQFGEIPNEKQENFMSPNFEDILARMEDLAKEAFFTAIDDVAVVALWKDNDDKEFRLQIIYPH